MNDTIDYQQLAKKIKAWGCELGFDQVAIADIDLQEAEGRLFDWLHKKHHGSMDYMERHGSLRSRPAKLLPGTTRVISVRLNYLPPKPDFKPNLRAKLKAYISRYAWGRDYHKLIRKRLAKLANKIAEQVPDLQSRPFVDSAPVMEKPLAIKAGLGWMGKHTNVINRQAGSWFFLGTLYVNIPLPIDQPVSDHCGSCVACMKICPTQAIVAPYQLDASRCISYLTIENRGSIPIEFRSVIGNRIYGCDDCQTFCPWNRYAKATDEVAFHPRSDINDKSLIELFAWDETTFLKNTEGSAIRRIGHESWLRNIAVALGNAPRNSEVIQALKSRLNHPSLLVKEHVQWALAKLEIVAD